MRSEDLAYFESEEFKKTLGQYEAALNEGRPIYMDTDELTDIAEYYMMEEREDEANRCIETALDLHPDAIEPHVFKARQQLFHGHIDKAKELAASIPDQQNREVQFLWAEIRIKENRQQDASQQLMHYFKTLSEEKDYFLYDTAGVFMDYNEWEIALMWAEELQKRYPDFERAELLVAEIKVCWGKCQDAIPELEAILDKNPFCAEAWNLLAEAHSALENYNEALDAIDYVLAIDENNLSAMLIRANSLFHMQKMEEAHQQYEKYLEKCPKDVSVLYFDSVTLANLEKYPEAIKRLEEALETSPEDNPERSFIYYQYGYLQNKLGQPNRALLSLELAYSLYNRELDTEYYLLKAQILLENHIRTETPELFEKAMELSKDKSMTLLTIAIEYAECEMYEKAVDILESMLSDFTCIMPNKEARCLPYLAYCTYYLLPHPRYKEYLQRSIQLDPDLTIFLFKHIFPECTLKRLKEEAK